MPSSPDRKTKTSVSLNDALDVLLWFGASMLRAGNTAIRTREWIEVMARKMTLDAVSVGLSFDTITASVRRSGERATGMRDIGPPVINAERIAELEHLAGNAGPAAQIGSRIEEIESRPQLYPKVLIVAAVGLASGGFAFLNGAAAAEMFAAAIGGGIGQWLRSWLSGRNLNHYGSAALAAMVASGTYVGTALILRRAGFEFVHYPAGFIASVLFLVPGFPLLAALFDLLRYQTVAAVSRLAYGAMILLAVALGLSIVIAVAGVDITRQPPLELAYPLKLLLRAIASFVATCAFAMLFNTSPRTLLAVGFVAVIANGLRLALIDMGMPLAPAAFFAALVIGLVALAVDRRFKVPRLAMTVAPIVIMIPGIYAFEAIVLFNRGPILEALQVSAACGFIVGALAMGLAAARFFSRK
jgi:uncharacterized membrane protein YjjP (DUF1212 family)